MARKTDRRERWLCVDLTVMAYAEAWALQTGLIQAKTLGAVTENLVLFVEHPPVFTLGRRGGRENLKVTEEFLTESGIQIVHVERGGNITFHGPGQIVIYPILDLRSAALSVVDYVHHLETVMIQTVDEWGISARRKDKDRGVWVGNRKIGSLGIAVRRGVAFHGGSLNVNVDLEPFQWIHPCGLKNIGVTSLKTELGKTVPMNRIRDQVRKHFMQVFDVEMSCIPMDRLHEMVDPDPGKRASTPNV